MSGPGCPDRKTLAALLDGRLPADELDRVAPHVEACPQCCGALELLSADTGHGAALDRTVSAGPLERTVLPLLSGILESCAVPGTLGKVGSWLIYEVIDRGGMGIVLRGQDPVLQREVALKLLVPELAGDAECRERFLREAQAAAAVDHENVMPVFAVCQDAALPYLVMPFNHGESLQQRLDREERLPFDETLRIGRAVAAGLAAAHAQGLVHRDVKPGNILLGRDGRVRIADFGLAQAAESTRLTRSGVLAGTPGYMAPEQLDGAVPDAQADLFSLGAVLYRMVTGTGPFEATTATAVMKKVVLDEPPPLVSLVRPAPPDWFVRLVGDLLQKKPQARPASAAEVVDRLDGKAAISRSGGRWRSLRAVALVALTGVSAGFIFSQLRNEKSDSAPPPVSLDRDLRMAAERAKTGPSAERVAWLVKALRKDSSYGGAGRMLLHELLFSTAPAPFPVGGVAVPVELTVNGKLRDIMFGNSGRDIFGMDEAGLIYVWDGESGKSLLSGFQWPQNARLLCNSRDISAFSGDDRDIWIVNHTKFALEGRLESEIQPNGAALAGAAPVLLVGGEDGRVESWNIESAPKRHSWPAHAAAVVRLLVTTDGSAGVSAAADGTVQILDFTAGAVRCPVLTHSSRITWMALSPDETLLATGSADATARIWDMRSGQPVTPPLRHPGSCPPDSGITGAFLDDERIVTAGTDDGTARIWDVRSGLPGHEPLLHGARVTFVAAQPGLFATGDDSGKVRLWDSARVEAASPPLVHSGAVTALRFSRDGTQLLAGGDGGAAWLYNIAPAQPVLPPWFLTLAEGLAARRIDAGDVVQTLAPADVSSLRTGRPETPLAEELFARQVADWLLSPAENRERQPFVSATPEESEGSAYIRELLFGFFREQVEQQMAPPAEKGPE